MRGYLVLLLVLVVGCGGRDKDPPPESEPVVRSEIGCEEALRAASAKVRELSDPKEMAKGVGECIKNEWPIELRRCIAGVRDQPDLVACMLRHRDKIEPHALRITGIDPATGDVEGGGYVRIKGNRFIDDGPRNAKVYFGSRQGTVVRFASDTELIVEAPGGRTGEVVDVLVIFDPGGQFKLPGAFTFTAGDSR